MADREPLNLTPGGRSHRMLAKLAESNGHFGHLAAACGIDVEASRTRRRKLWHLLDVLLAHGLLTRDGTWFTILPAGEAEVERLNAVLGYDPRDRAPGTSVRVFAREARA